MKLIRLATDNDGLFASAFQNDMVIAPQSQMALLNLTFKTNIGTFVVIPPGANITMKTDNTQVVTQQTVAMPENSYKVGEVETFYKDVQHALNSSLQNDNSRGAGNKSYNGIGSAFRIGTSDNGLKTIEYRYAPFINPITNFNNPVSNSMIWFNDYITPTVTGAAGQKVTSITKNVARSASDGRAYKVLPLNGRRLNDGSALFTARVADSVDNGSGNDDNGFGIGLSRTNLGVGFDNTADIPADQRDFEIRFNRMGETYKFITNLSNENDSFIQPRRVESATYPNVNEHDVLFMEVSGNVLQYGVIQDDGATAVRRVFNEVNVAAGEELYPYLYIRGASTDVKVDAFNYTIDPWLPGIGGDNDGNDEWQITGKDDTAFANSYQDILDTVPMNTAITQVDQSDRWDEAQNIKFNLTMNFNILNALGFTQFKTDGGFFNQRISRSSPVRCWKVILAPVLPVTYSSDNFIVESMSLPLDSFDASKTNYPISVPYDNPATDKRGRRKNILMTIPVNDNDTGLVEYESSTPIFVDINNAEEINAKNLNFRILNKDFSPIIQADETAIATILIKKQNE